MPLRPEYQDGIDMDDFFDQLTSIKEANLENLRNSVVDAPSQPIMPKAKNPNEMQEIKMELEANKQIATESQASYNFHKSKREAKKTIPLLIGGYLAYKFFL